MIFLDSMKVTTKLVVVWSLLIVGLVLSVTHTSIGLNREARILADASQSDQKYLQLVDLARSSQVAFKKQVQEWKDLLLRGNNPADFEKYNKQFLAQEASVAAQLDEIAVLQRSLGISTTETEELKREMVVLGGKYKEALLKYETNNPESGKIVDKLVKGMDRTPTDKMDALVASIVKSSKSASADNVDRNQKDVQEILFVTISLSALFIVIVSAISILVYRNVSKPLAALLAYSREVSSGNFNVSIEYSSGNEIGELAASISAMVQTLKEKLGFAQGIMKAITTPCVISDTSCRIIHANQAVIDLIEIGGKPDDYTGMKAGEFFYNDHNRMTVTEKVCATKTAIINAMADVNTRKGHTLHCRVDAAPVVGLDGNVIAGLALVTDLTEVVSQRKMAEAQTEKISLVAREADGISLTIAEASTTLADQVELTSRSAADQQTRISEAAAAMEEMSATILDVAKSAGQAADTAARAKEKATEGASIVGRVIQGIDDIHRESVGLKDDMAVLGGQAESIGQIMNVISDIADQTNLLALNAAIEAARAGEAGRGFAVVADEVRKLAEKTMSATKEVGEAIRGIQHGTQKNIESVDRSVRKIDDVNSLSGSSGESLREIVDLVDQTTDQVRSIATASEEQSSASEEITRSIEDVGKLTVETTRAMNQSEQEVSELARQAQELKQLIGTMQDTKSGASVQALGA